MIYINYFFEHRRRVGCQVAYYDDHSKYGNKGKVPPLLLITYYPFPPPPSLCPLPKIKKCVGPQTNLEVKSFVKTYCKETVIVNRTSI